MPTIPNLKNELPHLVILGAGASLAAFPEGDKNGKALPLMSSLFTDLNLTNTLKKSHVNSFDNFEILYEAINNDPSKKKLQITLEEKISRYFYGMKILSTPTLYDYLILSLRKKDVIATFNWDPLLLQSARRHKKYKDHLPAILFLHGNVAVGICSSCNIMGYKYNKRCHRCLKTFESMPLLYPVGKKKYSDDKNISNAWSDLAISLKQAYYVTIFGYSAPVSDFDAKTLMTKSFNKNKSHEFSQVEIIDIKPEPEITDNWRDFFYHHHYDVMDNFNKSQLWWHPRRSCEAHASALLMNSPWPYDPFPLFNSISEMHDWINPFINEEKKHGKEGIELSSCKH